MSKDEGTEESATSTASVKHEHVQALRRRGPDEAERRSSATATLLLCIHNDNVICARNINGPSVGKNVRPRQTDTLASAQPTDTSVPTQSTDTSAFTQSTHTLALDQPSPPITLQDTHHVPDYDTDGLNQCAVSTSSPSTKALAKVTPKVADVTCATYQPTDYDFPDYKGSICISLW
jgi:hypothetical protein